MEQQWTLWVIMERWDTTQLGLSIAEIGHCIACSSNKAIGHEDGAMAYRCGNLRVYLLFSYRQQRRSVEYCISSLISIQLCRGTMHMWMLGP